MLARARACSTRAKHITPGPPVKRHRLHTRVFQARNPNQKCFAKREARMTRGKSHFDAAPPPSPFIYISQIAFKKSAILWDYRERLSRPGGRGEEERKKKTKKIIIKMSHRESPMSRKSERKKREKKKNSEILLKSGGNPPSTTLSPPVDPFSIPALRVQRYTSLGYLGRTARTQTSISIVFNARREDLSSPFLHGVPPFLG